MTTPTDSAAEGADRVASAAQTVVDGLADRAKAVAEDVAEATEKVVSSAKDATTGAFDQFKAAYAENPVRTAVIAGAVALGAIAFVRGLVGRR